MTEHEKIMLIVSTMWKVRNYWNEHEWDFYGKFVFIGDILDWMGCNHIYVNNESNDYWYLEINKESLKTIMLFNYWIHKEKPIHDQSDECIDLIVSLIKSKSD